MNPWADLLGELRPLESRAARLVHFDGGEHGSGTGVSTERKNLSRDERAFLRRERNRELTLKWHLEHPDYNKEYQARRRKERRERELERRKAARAHLSGGKT